MEQTLSVREAARALSIGRTTLYKLINADELCTIKIRNRRLIIASGVDAFIARSLAKGAPR